MESQKLRQLRPRTFRLYSDDDRSFKILETGKRVFSNPDLKRLFASGYYLKEFPLPETYKEVLVHATKGGARSFILAYLIRAGVNFCLYFLRAIRGRASLSKIFIAAFRGTDALRFGAMFGIFSFLWKGVNNTLRIARRTDDRVNGFIAGSIAAVALIAEKKERRLSIAQQLFVRALQTIYNAGKSREYFHFKHGDALLFALTSAQVLYAYTMSPSSLPPDFYRFMIGAARVPADILQINCDNVRGIPLVAEDVLGTVSKYKPTKHALEVVSSLGSHPTVIPCEVIHPYFDSCQYTFIERFYQVFRTWLPVYGSLHFVPALLLRTKQFMNEPTHMLLRTAIATIKSGAFLASFVSLYQGQICLHRNAVNAGMIAANSKYLYYLAGVVCAGASIFIEDKRRRSELAMYVLPKAAESLFEIWYKRRWVVKIKHGEVLMASMAMGVIMSFYQREPDVLSSFVRRIMYQFFQRN